ncbi:uncharacterized protein TNCV_4077071 [Trichonephila clavipes]|nr:uncharacterized protein TNCV_4077071 [Trichonephila clavipes]
MSKKFTLHHTFSFFKLEQRLVEASNLHFRNAFGPTEVQQLQYNVPLLHFLIDFNALLHKNQRCFATCANSSPDHDRLRVLAMFDNCRGAWSDHAPDFIVLGLMNLLNRKQLLISEKESLPVLTCSPSQKFSASEPYEFVLFSEKLNF